jgi:RNA polymerase sigma factor (TIGR02999 family)
MAEQSLQEVTQMLAAASGGDKNAAEKLMPLVYDELRALAAGALRRERAEHTLQPTALVHEAFLRLIDQSNAEYNSRTHFFAIGAQMIRRVLVDHARRHHAAKRGGHAERFTLTAMVEPGDNRQLDVIALDDALKRLAELDERQARVVELRFFGGLSVEQTADMLEVSPRTVEQDWRMARAWLKRELSEEL